MLVPCPWCGEREEDEFRYGGAAGIPYPLEPDALDDRDWSRFVFFRPNPKGPFHERWVHQHGCRRWFAVVRDTATHEILSTHRIGEAP